MVNNTPPIWNRTIPEMAAEFAVMRWDMDYERRMLYFQNAINNAVWLAEGSEKAEDRVLFAGIAAEMRLKMFEMIASN